MSLQTSSSAPFGAGPEVPRLAVRAGPACHHAVTFSTPKLEFARAQACCLRFLDHSLHIRTSLQARTQARGERTGQAPHLPDIGSSRKSAMQLPTPLQSPGHFLLP